MKLIFLTALEDICSCFKPKITSGWYIFYFISLLSWFKSVLIFRYLYQKSRGWKWSFSSVLCEKRNCVTERFLSRRTEKVISVSAPSNLKWSAASQKSKACGEEIQSVAFTRSRTCCTDDRSLGWDLGKKQQIWNESQSRDNQNSYPRLVFCQLYTDRKLLFSSINI